MSTTDRASDYPSLPDFAFFHSFKEAGVATLSFLCERYGFGLWMITRAVQDDWIVLQSNDRAYGVHDGDVLRWSDSFCYQMVRDNGPHVARETNLVEAYRGEPLGAGLAVRSYVGYPLVVGEGRLFGTLCALDPEPMPAAIEEDESLFTLLAKYLSLILNDELESSSLSDRIATLEDVAYHDKLTEVLNRLAWDALVEQQEVKCCSVGEPTAVIMVDLDGLKQINDTKGHAAGDDYIRSAARALSKACRPSDVVARIGGDEFGLLVEGDIALDPTPLLRRIDANLRAAGVQASVGYAARDPRRSLSQAIAKADGNMYVAKRAKKQAVGA